MAIPSLIPSLIPDSGLVANPTPPQAQTQFSLYDVSIGGLPFVYAVTSDNPLIRQTAPFEKTRIDQAESPGEQTLSNWWIKSQDSFHGGAGQLQLEPSVPTPVSHVRYALSKNVDPFTPGQLTRLPDTKVVSTDSALSMVAVNLSGGDAIVYRTSSGVLKLLTTLDGTPVTSTFSGVSNVTSIATDGRFVYATDAQHVYQLDPNNVSAAVTLATMPVSNTNGTLGWVKARLMLGQNATVWGLDVTQTAVTLVAAGTDPYFLYTHPTVNFVWRCFAESPTAILAAGDAFGVSIIVQFDTQQVSGVPTLAPDGQMAAMPVGERIMSMLNSEGTYLGIGTTKGFRVGEFDSYFSRLTYGPLQLLPTDPTIICSTVLARDRFFYAVGKAYDEAGLIAVDLSTKTDSSGRFAWAPSLIGPTFTSSAAGGACTLPVSARIAFYVAGTGIVLEQVGAGTGRESWLLTSRIRFDTTEPKLFKLGRIRGDLTSGDIAVTATTAADTFVIGTYGFTTIDPTEFRLPTDPVEWMQLTMTLNGSDTALTSYQVKALPGTRRQRQIQPVLSLFDSEVSRNGTQIKGVLTTRARLEALEALDAAGDEILLQEFTPGGVVSTVVVIQDVKFTQIGRPTSSSDLGGTVAVLMQTVEG